MGHHAAQLPLNVSLRDDATFENFYCDMPAHAAVAALRNTEENLVYLYGVKGSGRSHLLQAVCNEAMGTVLYLPLAELRDYAPAAVLDCTEHAALACLDDLDCVVGDEAWEEALFHLINRARQQHCRLVFSASSAPRQLPVLLPDLQSRLSWAVVYALSTPDEHQLKAVLALRAQNRGMNLSEAVLEYILRRCERDTPSLMAVLDKLDRQSLAHGRRLTREFVGDMMGWR